MLFRLFELHTLLCIFVMIRKEVKNRMTKEARAKTVIAKKKEKKRLFVDR